jgi:anti-sigma28 factor (negative regulator of flagellin synthesis)
MSIHKIGSDLIRPAGGREPVRGSASSEHADSEELRRVDRADRVEISAEGRELAAQLLREGEALTESRAEMIRSRIENGFYNDPSVAQNVAERLLATGDLQADA